MDHIDDHVDFVGYSFNVYFDMVVSFCSAFSEMCFFIRTSGVLWDLPLLFFLTGIGLSVKRDFMNNRKFSTIIFCLFGSFWYLNLYQQLHLQYSDIIASEQPPKIRVMNYIFHAKFNQSFTLKSYIILYKCRAFIVRLFISRRKSSYMSILLLKSGNIERNPGPASWAKIRNPTFCNFLRVSIYKVFSREKLLPQDESDLSLDVELIDGFNDLKNLFQENFDANNADLKPLKKNIKRFTDDMKNWGRTCSSDRNKYCELFSPSIWVKMDNSSKKT